MAKTIITTLIFLLILLNKLSTVYNFNYGKAKCFLVQNKDSTVAIDLNGLNDKNPESK